MQQPTQEPAELRMTPQLLWEVVRFMRRYRKQPEALEPYLESLRARGKTQADMDALRSILVPWRETANDRATLYRIDLYVAAGVAAVDLVLLTVVLPMGASDGLLFAATLGLAVSSVAVAVSLFVSFVKGLLGITGYGKVHSNVLGLAQVSCVATVTATFWHSSTLAGIVFLVLAVLGALGSILFYVVASLTVAYVRYQRAHDQPPVGASSPTDPSGTP